MHRRPHAQRPSALIGPLLVVLVLIGLLWTTVPAGAVAQQTLLSPMADTVVQGSVLIVATVTPEEGEIIEGVDARVRGDDQRLIALEPAGEPTADGTQEWRGTVDPLEGLPLANGPYQVEVQARPVLGDPPEYTGHGVRLEVPAPRRELDAVPAEDEPTSVSLTWETVALPDFVAYRIQRRSDAEDGTWSVVQELADPRLGAVQDDVPDAGAYRYRLIVVRADGRGGELFSTSDPRGVRADPDDPGTFQPPREPDPQPVPRPQPRPTPEGEGPSPITRPTDPATPGPTPSPGQPSQSSGPPATGNGGRPPTIRVPAQPAPAAPRPAVPFNDGTFDPLLPFEETQTEFDVQETETALLDGGRQDGGSLSILTEDARDRLPWIAAAVGLLLLVASAHLRRFLADGLAR